jgi:predicted MFS family arabinose efflux permease
VLISDLLPEERQLNGQGLKVVVDRIAMILLPIVGGVLATLSWRATFACYAAVLPVAVAAFIAMPETCAPGSDSLKPYVRRTLQALREPRLAVAFSAGFLRFFLDYGLYTYLPLLLSFRYGLKAGPTGWIIAASASGSILTALFIGRIHSWLAAERLLAIAFLASAIGLIAVAAAPPLWLVTGAMFLFGLGNGLISPLQKNLLTRRTPIALRGGVISLDRLIQQVAKSIAPALLGMLLVAAPLASVFWTLAAFAAVGALVAARLAPENDADASPSPEAATR